ncbi:MAG TPA: hypothetical protein VKJ77_17955, partial [Caballeronia sp.]|nr:hypothetical protein [Caballeronia sp.]
PRASVDHAATKPNGMSSAQGSCQERSGPSSHAASAHASPTQDRDLKTTPSKYAKECILKIDCIVNIILSNELRANAPPETMF